MAINPSLPIFTQRTPLPREMGQLAQAQFRLPTEASPTGIGMEQATRQFGESIQGLSAADRTEIQIIHEAVDKWAITHPEGDRLGQFTARVMVFCDDRLTQLESRGNGGPESQGLEKVFLSGYQMVVSYTSLQGR